MAQYRQPVPPMSEPTHVSLSRDDRQRPPSPDTEASRARLIGWVQRALRWVGWLVAVVLSMLLLAAAALYGVLLPRAGEWRPDIEREATRAFGVPVQIGRIAIQSEGWNPTLEISDIVFLDNRQRPALRLPRIEAVVSLQSLLSLQLRFDWLLIEDAALEIRRDAQGRLHVAGLDLETAEPDAAADFDAADWLMRQGQLVIRRGQLRWVDEMRRAPPLALSDVDVVLRNGLRRHEIRVDATPPAGWGERWSVRGRFTQPLLARPGDWRRWSGELHAELPRADVAQLRRHVDLPFELTEGDGALRAWLEVRRGQPQALTLDVALREVSMRLAPRLQRLVFEQVEGRVVARQDRDALQFELRQLGFTTGDGLVWPRSDLSVSLRHRERTGGTVAPSVSAPASAAVPAGAAPPADAPASPAATAASSVASPASAASATELESEADANGEHRFLAISPSSEIVSGELSASRLDVGLLAAVAGRVPLGDPVRQALERLAPQGIVEGLQARWEGPLDQPSRYSVNARLSGVQVAAGPVPAEGLGRPGVRGAAVDLDASESGGRAVVTIEQGALVLPGALEDPTVPLQRLSGRVDWRLQPRPAAAPQVEIRLSDVKLANAELQGQVEGTWRTGPGDGFGRGGRFPGELDLKAQVQRLQATAVARYLPLGLSEETRRYVGRAARSGTVSDVSIRIRGDLWSAPYPSGADGAADGGLFRIEGRLDDVGLAYLPSEPGWRSPWPEVARVRGRLMVDGDQVQWNNLQGRLAGVELSRVAGSVRYANGDPQLTLDGQARGGLNELLRFVQTTPVGEWLGGALARSSGAGAATLGLKLEMPLRESRKARVRGSLQLTGNELRIRPEVPALSNARGRLDFTERGFTLVGTRAVVTGGETVIEGGFQPETGLRLSAQGSATAEGLRRATELGVVATLAERARGTSTYRLNLAIQQGRTELALNSSLVGLAFNLPSPLDKVADAPLPLSLQIRPTAAAGSAAAVPADRDQLDVSLGRVLQMRALRDTSGPSARVLQLAAAVGAGEPLPVPVAGGQASVRLDRLDVDAWMAALEAPSTSPPAGVPAVAGADSAGAAPAGDAGLPEFMPRRIRVAVRELLVQERRLERVQAQMAQDAAGTWRAEIDAVQLAGRVEWRPAAGSGPSADPGRVQARLSRLSLPPSESAVVENLLDQPRSSLPALDVVIDEFELRGKRLGKLEVDAVHQPLAVRAGGGEWRLRRFVLANPDATLSATGSWGTPLPAMGEPGSAGAARRMRLAFQMQLQDSGALLSRLGFGEVLRGGQGRLDGDVSWLGSPLSLNTATLQGKLQLALEEGRFLKADPGAARLLGVLSLQALPRRLLLDFRDVFQEGFVFDEATADAVIEAGVARTNNFRMRGVQAAVLLEGTADIGRETQDLRVVVVPEINAGTASLAYAAINPAIGLGSFLAQLIFRRPLIAANTREFAVTGTWSDPKVERLDRIEKEAEAAARANPATPQSSPAHANPPPRSAP